MPIVVLRLARICNNCWPCLTIGLVYKYCNVKHRNRILCWPNRMSIKLDVSRDICRYTCCIINNSVRNKCIINDFFVFICHYLMTRCKSSLHRTLVTIRCVNIIIILYIVNAFFLIILISDSDIFLTYSWILMAILLM